MKGAFSLNHLLVGTVRLFSFVRKARSGGSGQWRGQGHAMNRSTLKIEFRCAQWHQKTREGCGHFRGLFGGSPGKLRESPEKIAGKCFPNREMLQILGFRSPGKANLPGTLGRHCRDLVPTFRAGCFLISTVPAFSSFSEIWERGSGGVKSAGVSLRVRETSRDESQCVPSPEKNSSK